MYIAILGRQPALGMAELERHFGSDATRWFSDQSATIKTDQFSIEQLGGTQKAGRVVYELPSGDWQRVSMKIVQAYSAAWADVEGKITLGISAYGFDTTPHDIQRTGILLKQKLKKSGVSLRAVPNAELALNTATAHHNKLGLSDNKVELIVVRARSGRIIVAESTGAQNITALARRDQGRPKRDAFVGMLPPKLALMMVNLGVGRSGERVATSGAAPDFAPRPADERKSGADSSTGPAMASNTPLRILDPFCGTGVILQEAALRGFAIYGTDLADKMIDFSRTNIEWLADSHNLDLDARIDQGDATDTTWQQPIDAIVCESYLGQPFSAPPSPTKLDQVRKTTNHIITAFLENIAEQIPAGTPLCVAVPAWKSTNNDFTHLPLIGNLDKLGYSRYEFSNVKNDELLYYRQDQVVARELLVLVKT